MTLQRYMATRPKPRPFHELQAVAWSALRRFVYLLAHTVRIYELGPGDPEGLSKSSPTGKITGAQLPMCERLAAQASERLAQVEQKATTLLSLVGLLAPLSIAAVGFLVSRRSALHPWGAFLGLELFALAFLLLASIAIMRALTIREHKAIGLGGLIGSGAVRQYDVDFEARGLLYVATTREAIADHVADFVRAAQVFLWVAIATQILTASLTAPLMRDAPTQVQGTFALAPETIRQIRLATVDRTVAAQLDSLFREEARTQEALRQVQTRLLQRDRTSRSARTPR